MSWNYRVIRTLHPGPPGFEPEEILDVHEVYYLDDEITPRAITVTAVAPCGHDGLDSLKEVLELYAKALEKPILNYADFTDDGYIGTEK